MNIGFIGLGIMGVRMAANLQKHDYALTVYNRTPHKADTLVANGATLSETPAQVGEAADVLITMLAHPQAVEQTAHGEDGFLSAMRPDTLWMDCSTVNPSFSRQMAAAAQAHNVRFMDAPVAGTKPQAENAQLVFFVGGADDDVAQCQPLFEAMGSRVAHMGAQGMGISMKVVVNHLLATGMMAFAEAVALGRGLGIAEETLFNSLLGGPLVAPALSSKREKMAQDDYTDVQFPLRWLQKDLQMASTAAYEQGVAMPTSNAAKEVYQLAVRQGLGDLDFAAIYRFLNETQD